MSDNQRAQVGQDSHVEVELVDEENNRERMAFDLVADSAADFALGRVGVGTPLGKAIRGKFVGSVVPYVMGDIRQVRILSASPLQAPATDDAAARRQAILDEARRKAERTNSDMFASSYSGKWGDYSTDEIEGVDNE
ncbi:MAG: GreA/GreB family elongation factor [Caldilineaceae bacterium]|nr:GreA/GreB family elongation factor [Caldilineaceae bacterium]